MTQKQDLPSGCQLNKRYFVRTSRFFYIFGVNPKKIGVDELSCLLMSDGIYMSDGVVLGDGLILTDGIMMSDGLLLTD